MKDISTRLKREATYGESVPATCIFGEGFLPSICEHLQINKKEKGNTTKK